MIPDVDRADCGSLWTDRRKVLYDVKTQRTRSLQYRAVAHGENMRTSECKP